MKMINSLKGLVSLTAIIICCVPVQTPSLATFKYVSHTYISEEKTICMKCPPGTYVEEDCHENFIEGTCIDCRDGTFSTDFTRAKSCEKCHRWCSDEHQIQTKCTKTGDITCTCEPGYKLVVDDENLDEQHCQKIETPDTKDQKSVTDSPKRSDPDNETARPRRCKVSVVPRNNMCMECTVCHQGDAVQVSDCHVLPNYTSCLKGDSKTSHGQRLSSSCLVAILFLLVMNAIFQRVYR
ncbi:tumor necrosis factor receptor superfamily member 11B-like [Gigantopelta aegis]|uniref:tumor necrosis factor receptor superfamily member 11B-like n=1 Tax=Gigantopelta aegis TaxID=1735272 RepID=UPI001B88C396|nr:tumor necrosis factor receptor superfamily member 11B-like [Gigantopelta aegis]